MQTDHDEEKVLIEEDSHPVSGNLMESKTSHLDDVLNEKLQRAFHQQTFQVIIHDVAKIASEHSPIDLAYAASRLPPSARHILFDNLADLDAQIEFIVNTDRNTRMAVFRHLEDIDVKKLIEKMPPDDAVAVLEDIPERRFRRVVDMLEAAKAQRIREIKKHQRNTAGRLMTNEFFAFLMDVTVGEAAAYIRDHPGIDLTRLVFVVDPEGELQGYVPSRNLIVNGDHLPLKEVMQPVLHKVTVDTTREEVVDIVERYKVSALPVVDERDRLEGVVTDDAVLEAIEDIADETIASMAGTAEKVKENDPFLKRFLSRVPWLLVTLAAGLINMQVMSFFQNYEKGMFTFILFVVPLITGMSGNIGIQCSTILVRSMGTGLISVGSKREAVLKEIAIGLLNGVVFGVLCGFFVYVFDLLGASALSISPATVGIVIGMGLFGACLAGASLGVFSPLLFARVGVDPAIAAGPIITAFNDFLSMSIYFLIATGLSTFLFS
jgi:magnesium transporter